MSAGNMNASAAKKTPKNRKAAVIKRPRPKAKVAEIPVAKNPADPGPSDLSPPPVLTENPRLVQALYVQAIYKD